MRRIVLPAVCMVLLGVTAAVAQNAPEGIEMFPMELIPNLMDLGGGEPLFKEDLSNATFEEQGWAFENGNLVAKGKGDIWTKERYGNFMLNLEFRCEEKTNSGVFFRCGDIQDWLHSSMEIQILQNNQDYENPKHHCGGLFDCKEPLSLEVKKPGEWNILIIVARDNKIYSLLNGKQVLGVDLDKWTEAHKNPDGTPNKFNNAYKEMPREGYIGLQYHGQPIVFRNMRVRALD